ncbi:hypothetical protein GLOIN_2v1612823 [Rhizophagus irregularis DAOM 181602=DAOM 197198]|uniref:Uncharacterized protein n=2 Tax=Rhizophagus irregularis TaxID=588596 RepID=A0A015IEE2_RHIIW|nr:hypothetical protein GLOIN_2v1612823 [Rhizophagus irregularis DAOM 181602=DAOM 197198]EXX52325.1 hypothetical protein RirG_253750 [Rhizophagus irregularis DAOM 197198w]POG70870.1 hypothetical protein GLOIN_2v1612823 [Rhizophagus irregularis DAOM 181602=DAOM 197198]|eukprot:XP_025177736.1 hypothetical protein GLOIN_2v1612823 [Rhizophagus irregularis DAOM 181602=DAOM 197198]
MLVLVITLFLLAVFSPCIIYGGLLSLFKIKVYLSGILISLICCCCNIVDNNAPPVAEIPFPLPIPFDVFIMALSVYSTLPMSVSKLFGKLYGNFTLNGILIIGSLSLIPLIPLIPFGDNKSINLDPLLFDLVDSQILYLTSHKICSSP